MSLIPLHDRIAVEREVQESVTKGGIIVQGSTSEASQIGKVFAVGEGRRIGDKLIPPSVVVGERVLLAKFAGQSAKYEGRDLLLIAESDILAVLED